MTDEETIRKLMNMRLVTMAQAFRDLLTQAPGSQMSVSELVAIIVDREWTDRENRKLARLPPGDPQRPRPRPARASLREKKGMLTDQNQPTA